MKAKNPTVAVIGAGVIGTMTAWQLSKRGFTVTVYDQWNTPNDRGASAGESRIFRTIYKEGPAYVPTLQKSLDLWEELQHNQRRQVLDMCGGLTIGHPDNEDVAAVVNCAEEANLDYKALDVSDMSAQYPQYRLDRDEIGVLDPAAGVFRPEAAVLVARDESERLGAKYQRYRRVLNVRPLSGKVMVDTEDGATSFDKVVVATGPWANELSGLTSMALAPRQLAAMWFTASDVSMHRPDRMPIAIRRHDEGGFSCFPVLDGVAVKIIPHHLSWPQLNSVDELPRFVDPAFVRAAEQAIQRLMPGLDPTAIRVSTYTEGFTSDMAPVVGPRDDDERVVLAVGMSGQGFKFSPMIGSIVADLVEKNSSSDQLALMQPARFTKR